MGSGLRRYSQRTVSPRVGRHVEGERDRVDVDRALEVVDVSVRWRDQDRTSLNISEKEGNVEERGQGRFEGDHTRTEDEGTGWFRCHVEYPRNLQ